MGLRLEVRHNRAEIWERATQDEFRYWEFGRVRACDVCGHALDDSIAWDLGAKIYGYSSYSLGRVICGDCRRHLKRPSWCRTCSVHFYTRNELFRHLRERNHFADERSDTGTR